MPLVIFSGFPSSGKSTWANKLAKELEDKIKTLKPNEEGYNMKVILHSDESLGIKREMYRESNSEKSARAIQMSAIKRDISKNNIVILDSMSYNKGFRYQLFCECKSAFTSNCLIQIICPINKCFELNSNKLNKSDKWDEDLLKQMIARFEEPDGTKRWDSPLITISFDDENLPLNEIWQILVLNKAPKPNLATILKPSVGSNYLQQLDKLTNLVINEIIGYQQIDSFGKLKIKNIIDNSNCYVELPNNQISTASLQRLKRNFINLNRVRNVDPDRIIPLFTEYLTNNLNAI